MAVFKGTSKSEILHGTSSADLMLGAGGDDLLYGEGGNDVLDGGRGDDGLYGGDGANRLQGGRGNDVMVGADADDTLAGGDGDDLLIAGLGADKMAGGNGNDIYSVDDTNDRVIEHEHEGVDEVSAWLPGYRIGRNIENLSFAGSGEFHGTGNARSNIMSGGSEDDMLDGCSGSDVLHGWEGDDQLLGRSGADTLDGGYGDDLLIGGSGDDVIDGGVGSADTVRFSGIRDDYTIKVVGAKVAVTDHNCADGDDGTDILATVEFLQFRDGTVPSPGPVSSVDLATLDGSRGFMLLGINPDDASGNIVSSAGDVNGDGFDDLLIVAPGADGPSGYDEGESYVVFGKAGWTGTPSIDLGSLNGTNGFRLNQRGWISAAGDVNADSFGDFLVGGNLVFGKTDWTGTPSFDVATLDGIEGFNFHARGPVSSAGDVNGDGFDDFIVGAPYAAYWSGESYVVFGKSSWANTPWFDVTSLDGTNGFKLVGDEGFSGFSVSSAGDVNGDGFDDVIVLAPFAYNDRYETGESYVVFGKDSWIGTPTIDLASLDGTQGFSLSPIDVRYSAGRLVSSAGDINGDGFDDLIIGAPYGANDRGESYVVFGRASWVGTSSLDLAALDGKDGFSLIGVETNDASGWSVSSAGDVNGDGFDDVIIGAPQLGSDLGYGVSRGESYVVYGKADWSGTRALDLAALDGTNGFSLIGINIGDAAGLSVSSAGDVNGDGFADLIIGAPLAEPDGGFQEGESYVVFGGNFTGAVTHLGGLGDDTLVGGAASETFGGGTGNDTLTGNGGADSFQGGAGNDTLRASSLDFLLADGGRGTDTLALDRSNLHLDLTSFGDHRARSIERIDLSGSGSNTLTLSPSDVLDLSDQSHELLVLGDTGDMINQGTGWTAAAGGSNGNGTSTIDGETYRFYHAGEASLLVDTDVTVSA